MMIKNPYSENEIPDIVFTPKVDFMYYMSRNPKFPKGKRAASLRARSNKRKAKRKRG